MGYQKLKGQGMRALYICPSDITEIPNPSDAVPNPSANGLEYIFRTAPSGGADIVELDVVDPTVSTLGLVGGDIIYFEDVGGALLGCGTITIPNMVNDRQFTIDWDAAFSGVINLAASSYKLRIYRRPTEFPMVSLPHTINNVETTFISAGGDGIELMESSATLSPSAYGSPAQLSVRGTVFPVQIRKILNSTVDKTGATTLVTSNTGWETFYLGTW